MIKSMMIMIVALNDDPIRIKAKDRSDLLLGLKRRGYELNNLFFKCNKNFYDIYAPFIGKLSDDPGKYVEWDFNNLREIYAALPQNTVVPVAMVVSNDYGYVAGYLTEFIEGKTLKEVYTGALAAMDQQLAVDYVRIVRGVEAAVNTLHEKGIAHGDISDTNIMVDADGTFKIIDPLRLKSMEISRKFDQEALKELRRSADHLDHLI